MRRNKVGFTLIELMLVVSIIGLLALIAMPNFQNLRSKAYDAQAQSAGYAAKLSEELYYQEWEGVEGYTNSLNDLAAMDQNLTDNVNVTFVFSTMSLWSTYYTFTTFHNQGNKTFIWHE